MAKPGVGQRWNPNAFPCAPPPWRVIRVAGLLYPRPFHRGFRPYTARNEFGQARGCPLPSGLPGDELASDLHPKTSTGAQVVGLGGVAERPPATGSSARVWMGFSTRSQALLSLAGARA